MPNKQFKFLCAALFLLAVLTATTKATASPSDVYIQNGFYGYENVMFNYNGTNLVTNAGQFQVYFDGDNSKIFRAFCVDLDSPIAYGTNMITGTPAPDLYNPGKGQYAEWLMENNSIGGYAALGTALQLAIWEVSYDLDTSLGVGSNYNLDYGNGYWDSFGGRVYSDTGLFSYNRFLVDASFDVVANAQEIELINGWYDAYIRSLVNFLDAGNTYSNAGDFFVAELANNKQDIIVQNPVPVPGSMLLLGCGLVILSLRGRRK